LAQVIAVSPLTPGATLLLSCHFQKTAESMGAVAEYGKVEERYPNTLDQLPA